MRAIITLALLCCVTLSFAQKASKPVAITDKEFNAMFFKLPRPTVSGRIINATKAELAGLQITYSLVTPFAAQADNATVIHEDGSFKFTLPYPFPYQQIWIGLGDYFYSAIYVNKGLALELDLAQLKKQNISFNGKGVKYMGTDGPLTNWLNNLVLYKREEQGALYNKIMQVSFDRKDYMAKLDSLSAMKKSIQDEYIAQHPSPYSWVAENERLSEYYTHLLWYIKMNKEGLQLWDKIKAHKPLLISNDAGYFSDNIFNYAYNDKAQKQDKAFDELMGIPYADALRLKKTNGDLRENESELRKTIAATHTPRVKAVLEDQHRNALAKLNAANAMLKSAAVPSAGSVVGTPVAQLPFGAQLSSVSKTKAADFLAMLHNQFKGKALILDIWGTWCLPCLNDMPFSRKLHDEAAGLPVEFVYLCTSSNSSMAKWKNKVIEIKQPGTHIFIDNALANELLAMFNKPGYPGYICFDQNGEVSRTVSINHMSMVTLEDVKKLVVK